MDECVRVGARVRVMRGIHAGAEGQVVSVHQPVKRQPEAWVIIDAGKRRLTAYISALKMVSCATALAPRHIEWLAPSGHLRLSDGEETSVARLLLECDRLRDGLMELRDDPDTDATWRGRLDAILGAQPTSTPPDDGAC